MKGRGKAGRENSDLRQDPEQCRCGQEHHALLSTGDPPSSPSPSHASPGTRLSSLLELVGRLSVAQQARRCVTGGHCQHGGSRTDPTALCGGGRGDLRSPGHLGILAIRLITDETVLQTHAQPLASPSECFVLGKGVLGEVAAPRGTHPKALWPEPLGDLSVRSGYPPPHGPWPWVNPLPLARQRQLPLPVSTGLAKAPTLCWHRILRLNPPA